MANGQDGDAALRAVADRLYAGPAAAFTSRRTAAAKDARAAGDRDLAARIGALARPTAAAQLVNALARRAPDDLQRVLDLGEELRVAQQQGDRDALRELSAGRRRLLAEVAERAAGLAERRPGDAVLAEVQQTLQAAMASQEAATAVRDGRLVRPLAADGLDPADLRRAVAVPSADAPRRQRATAPDPDEDEARRQRAVEAAEAAQQHAEELRRTADAMRAAARQAADDVAEREREVADLHERLDAADAAAEAARGAATRAARDADVADDEATRAAAASEAARAALD